MPRPVRNSVNFCGVCVIVRKYPNSKAPISDREHRGGRTRGFEQRAQYVGPGKSAAQEPDEEGAARACTAASVAVKTPP